MKTPETYITTIKNKNTAILVLEDGNYFVGQGLGHEGTCLGEICFNTSMTGYQEIITDPSYTGQIITFTFPHIGNVGTNFDDIESKKPTLSGIIIKSKPTKPSNFRSTISFDEWMKGNKVVGIYGIDTRLLTQIIRKKGPQNAIIVNGGGNNQDVESLRQRASSHKKLENLDLAKTVSCTVPYSWTESIWENGKKYGSVKSSEHSIVAIDFGLKFNILRSLASLNCNIKVVPCDTNFEKISEMTPDGVFLSNGPGDPAATGIYAVPLIKKLIKNNIPIFGICLGFQLLSIALGAKTIKMFQGHRGANHPVKDTRSGDVLITTQNHGFEVDKNSIPNDVEVTHTSLFDNCIEGIKSKKGPFFGVQFHPEASPGPQDSYYLFESFIELVKKNAKKN